MTIYAGVYEIVNKVNGHKYVGSSVDINRRWKQHRRELRKSRHSNVSQSLKAHYASPFGKETKEKISKAMTGRKFSDEHKHKISKSVKEYWAKKKLEETMY